MIGEFIYSAHVALQTITRPIRQRRAIAALRKVSDAKDAYRAAKVRGDKRAQHTAETQLVAARTEQLRAELALHSFASHPRAR